MNAKVLLVDDEPAVLKCLGTLLARLGHHVTTASSGEEALAQLEHRPFDLVVTDYRMPGISGAQVVDSIRERQEDTAIILITGLVDELPDWLRAGPRAVKVLGKPFEVGSFLHAVEHSLQPAMALA